MQIQTRQNFVSYLVGDIVLYNEKEVVEICNKYGIETVENKEYPLYQGKEMDEKFSIVDIMHEPIPITEE